KRSRVVRLGVYIAATPEFTEHPKVANAASELFRDVFGEEAVSSRLVIGVASLPLGSPVELEVILEVKTCFQRVTRRVHGYACEIVEAVAGVAKICEQ